jgi:phenylpropionate dioxygenase-like ring-hydroxylating dioxygenase large terminal subunit
MNVAARPPQHFARHHHENQPQSFEEVLATETRPVPDFVRQFGQEIEGPYEVPTRWYTDPAIYQAEVEALWKRKWQAACRVDHVPQRGDTYVYDIAGLSFVIVRVSDDLIKGYWNSCLHRGVPLRQCAGRVDRLQCPFHGFTWNLEGENVLVPHPEDFPHIDPKTFSLPEIQVAVWQGFVFINPDLKAEPFETYIGELDDQLQSWPYTHREVSLHVAKVFPANWKAVQEAFMESFHVLTTHPQYATTAGGDRCSDFRASGNVSRGILASGHTSDYVPDTPKEEDIFFRMSGWWDDEEAPDGAGLPEGATARQAVAQGMRENLRSVMGDAVDKLTDTELVDVYYYTIFPNNHPFGLIISPFLYRFRPYGNDPAKCLMEVMFLTPVAPGQQPKPPVEPIWLDEEQEFVEITQLGTFGAFISQDSSNLAGVMSGLRSSRSGIVNFARFHESKIRHFYGLYEEAMGLSASDEVRRLKEGA